MKFIISSLLIALVLISIIVESQCQHDVRKFRLNYVLENIIKNHKLEYGNEAENEVSRLFDAECAKSFFNLPQNNNMIVKDLEEIIFMIASAFKCSNEDKAFETIESKFIHEGMAESLDCLKWLLKQHEPTSILLDNFEINDAEIKKCQAKFPIYREFEGFQKSMEGTFGSLKDYTCGRVSDNGAADMLKFIAKASIIKYGDLSEELKKSEKEKLKEYFKDLAIGTVNCVIKRFEDDPQAFNINETLNFYYKKESQPADPDQYDPNDYYKRLNKLEEAIDQDCVKEKLNLPENGDKAVLEAEASVLIASAKSKCIKVNPLEFSDLFIDFALQEGQKHERYYACARYKLQKLEPTSKLAVITSTDEPHEKYCRHFGINLHPYTFPTTATCGVLTDDIVDVITLKTMLLFDEKDKELKINETKELYGVATDKLHKIADCILERAQ